MIIYFLNLVKPIDNLVCFDFYKELLKEFKDEYIVKSIEELKFLNGSVDEIVDFLYNTQKFVD